MSGGRCSQAPDRVVDGMGVWSATLARGRLWAPAAPLRVPCQRGRRTGVGRHVSRVSLWCRGCRVSVSWCHCGPAGRLSGADLRQGGFVPPPALSHRGPAVSWRRFLSAPRDTPSPRHPILSLVSCLRLISPRLVSVCVQTPRNFLLMTCQWHLYSLVVGCAPLYLLLSP